MNYEVNPRALKRVMAPADFSCPPPVNIELDNENSRRRRVNIQGELKLRLNRVILHSSKSVLYVKTWYFIFIFVYYLDIYSFSKAAAHAAPPSVSEVQSLVSGCGWAQHNDLMTWLWIVSLAFLRLEKSDTQFSGLRRLWISSKRKKLGIRGQKFTKVHKSKGSMNLFLDPRSCGRHSGLRWPLPLVPANERRLLRSRDPLSTNESTRCPAPGSQLLAITGGGI